MNIAQITYDNNGDTILTRNDLECAKCNTQIILLNHPNLTILKPIPKLEPVPIWTSLTKDLLVQLSENIENITITNLDSSENITKFNIVTENQSTLP